MRWSTYERNGGPRCIDEVYAIFSDGRITGDNGIDRIEKDVAAEVVAELLGRIRDHGWFTAEMYNTWQSPVGSATATTSPCPTRA